MRNAMMTACCLGLVALFAAPASAQGPGGGMMGGMGNMTGPVLMMNKGVQKELKLTEEQISKIEKAATSFREKMMEKTSGLRDASADERREIMAEVQKMGTIETKKIAEEVLKPEQTKRFHQISLQVRGIQALMMDAEVHAKLKITDEQKEKFQSIQADAGEKMQDLRDKYQDDRAGMQKAMTDMRKETFEKAVAALTSEQKATWKELTGEPFDYKPDAPMRRPN